MDLPIIEEVEFDEADLLYASGTDDEATQRPRSEAEDDSSVDLDVGPNDSPRNSIGPSSMKTGSARSATIFQGPFKTDDREDAAEDCTTSAFPELSATTAFLSRVTGMACSMPVKSLLSMGSSIPRNIPMYRPMQMPGTAAAAAAAATATAESSALTESPTPRGFIPPHQMSQSMAATQGFAFSLATGESMASIKRERLRTRNLILKSTGFLEKTSGEGAALQPGHIENMAFFETSPFVAGGLSRALSERGKEQLGSASTVV